MIKIVGSVIYAGVVAGVVGIGLHAVKESYIDSMEKKQFAKQVRNRKRLVKHTKQIRNAQQKVQFDDMWNNYFTEKTGKIS
ncbi:MAG: hypothetical protein ACRCX2_20130 [Paraclostridium sp.]